MRAHLISAVQVARTTDCNQVYSTTDYKQAKQVSQIRKSRQLARGCFQVSFSIVPHGGEISTSPRAADRRTAFSCRTNPVATGSQLASFKQKARLRVLARKLQLCQELPAQGIVRFPVTWDLAAFMRLRCAGARGRIRRKPAPRPSRRRCRRS